MRLKPDTINRHVGNVYPALAMLAGMELDVFSKLNSGPKTATEVARALNVDTVKLRPLLYALVTAGLLENDGEEFTNTAEADEFLVKGKPRYLGGSWSAYADLWSATLRTATSIRTGTPQAKHDFTKMSHAELSAFIRGLDASAAATARRLQKEFTMTGFRDLLDAGGGSGGLAITLCNMNPHLRATVAELSNVAAVTRECITEAQLEARVAVIETDLVTEIPPGDYDVAILRSLLQVLSAADAARVVKNVTASLAPDASVFVVGRMLDDTRLSPLDAVAANVMFLNVYDDGQAYTEAEYRRWLAGAGLSNIARHPLAGGYSIMSARKFSV